MKETFEVIPAIDIRGGRCVRLTQGDYAREKVYADDPVEMARHWVGLGAERIHLVDLDGAREGYPVNLRVIERIRDTVDVTLEIGGGIRSVLVVDRYLESGLDFVILGSVAFSEEDYFCELVSIYPNRVILGLDAKEGEIRIRGWLETRRVSPSAAVSAFNDLPLAAVILTDISQDGMMRGPNFKMIEDFLEVSRFQVIASGGVSSLEHVERLRKLHPRGCAGAILGKALYEETVSLPSLL